MRRLNMNYKISRRAASLTPSLTLAIDAKAKEMKAEGIDVVGFGAGEPDFATPQAHQRRRHQGAAATGSPNTRPAAASRNCARPSADKFKRDNGLTYKPSQIIISCGGKHSCCNVILATCNPGDEVIIPAPYWLSYPEMARLAEAKPVILRDDRQDGIQNHARTIARRHHAAHAACSFSIRRAIRPARFTRRRKSRRWATSASKKACSS